MVTKQEVIDHYANARARPGDDAPGICPRSVVEALDAMAEDKYGIYDMAVEFFGWERRYLTLDEVKESVRASIDDLIAELRKIQAI
jgi:hypothetical protein